MNKNKVSEILLKAQQVREKIGATTDAAERENLQREYNGLMDQANEAIAAINAENAEKQREQLGKQNQPAKTPSELLREQLNAMRKGEAREAFINTFASVVTPSGTQPENIHVMINTLNEGLGLPVGCQLVGGVTGNDIWPVGVNDIDMEEVGENVALNDTSLDFDKITCSPKRAGLTIDISNKALDEAGFDLNGYVMGKINLAKRKYLAQKIYSQAEFTGVKGPFSGLAKTSDIDITGGKAFANILDAVAAFTNAGFTGEPCLIMDAVTEAKLKACPKVAGEGAGFVIENGKCAGYNYVVSHYINTTLGTAEQAGKLVPTAKSYIGLGYFNYLAVQQHGQERLTTDGTSKAVAIANKFNVTYNTEFSITDLSVKLNKKGGTTTQAFALYEIK